MERELSLRAHIRTHLLEYCFTHITTNYIEYTEYAVGALLSQSLVLVPITDQYSLVLRTDPLDTFLKSIPSASMLVNEEKWFTDSNTVQHIRHAISDQNTQPMTERCWEDGDSDWTHFSQMSSLLTFRAIRETPRLGRLALKSTSESLKEVLKSTGTAPISVPDIPDVLLPSVEDVLNMRYTIDPTTHTEIVGLLKKIPAYSKTTDKNPNPHMDTFLRSISPSLEFPDLYPLPIFPRNCRPGHGRSSSSSMSTTRYSAISDFHNLREVKVEEDDINMEHMVVVNGWQAYQSISSPTPTPSLREGSTSSQMDELFLLSSPNSYQYRPLDFESAKMDEVQIPRCNRFGQGTKQPKLGEGESFSKFITSRLAQSALNPQLATTPKSHPSSPCANDSGIDFSMLGQPPSATSIHEDVKEDDTFSRMTNIWKAVIHGDFADVILEDGLDPKDGLLMEVPGLPPPNQHPTNSFLPANLRSLVSQSSASQSGDGISRHISTVKGVKALNLELSWIPFKFGKKVPTDEEVAGVSFGPLDHVALDGNDDHVQQINILLQCTSADCIYRMDDVDYNFEAAHGDDDDLVSRILDNDELHRADIILTKEERHRLAYTDEKYHNVDYISFEDSTEHVSGDCTTVYPNQQLPEMEQNLPAEMHEYKCHSEFRVHADYHNFDQTFVDHQDYFHDHGFDDTVSHPDWEEQLEEDMDLIQPPAKRVKLSGSLEDTWFPVVQDDQLLGQGLYEDSGIGFLHGQTAQDEDDMRTSSSVEGFVAGAMDESVFRGIQDDSQMFDFTDTCGEADAFYPLSFDSTKPTRALLPDSQLMQVKTSAVNISNSRNEASRPDSKLTTPSIVERRDSLPDLPLPSASGEGKPTVDSTRNDIANFLKLRRKVLNVTSTTADAQVPRPDVAAAPELVPDLPSIPQEIFNRDTLRLSDSLLTKRNPHFYLASCAFIQKRTLVISLSHHFSVDLIERDTLVGVDLILDHETAVIFMSLMALPSECDYLCAHISTVSWRFKYLLVVFECYPAARSYTDEEDARHVPFFAFSPPAVKAVQKLRRGVGIAEGSMTKRVDCQVNWAFAETPAEAAKFARDFGDVAEGRDETAGTIWGPREWLIRDDGEEFDGEGDLASAEGLNTFVACVVLSQVSLEQFLDMSPETRINRFSYFLGIDRMVHINDVLFQRYSPMFSSPAEALNTP